MKKWSQLKNELLKNKQVALEYKKMQPHYILVSQLIEARMRSGLTQKELAEKMGTKQSAISRLESGNTNPSITFLEKLAHALGRDLKIQLT